MIALESLNRPAGAFKSPKRLGRGRGSGLGQTSGKGHKGQLARSGGKVRRGFEGGQSMIVRRLPKVGFNNKTFATDCTTLFLKNLSDVRGEVDLVGTAKQGTLVRVVGRVDLKNPIKIKAHYFSVGAKQSIEAAKGEAIVVGGTK